MSDFVIENGVLIKYTGKDENVVIPEGVTTIGFTAFIDSNLITVSIPQSVSKIEACAFSCSNLEEIKIPESVTEIGERAFINCKNLKRVFLPSHLEAFGKEVFENCSKMLEIHCNGKTFGILDGETKDNLAILWLTDRATFDKDQVAAIEKYIGRTGKRLILLISGDNGEAASKLLSCCKIKLEDLDILISKYNDGKYSGILAALLDYKNRCYSVQEEEALAKEKLEKDLGIKELTLSDFKKIFKFKEADGAICINGYKGNDSFVEIPAFIDGKPVKSIHDKALQGLKEVTTIILPEGITDIGKNAFSGCGITDITLPGSIETIGNGAFSGCALERIEIPNNTISLGWYVFNGCDLLKEVILPESLQEIGCYAFLFCEALENIVLPNGIKKIGTEAFANCCNLANVILPDSPAKIGNGIFTNCEKLEEIVIPKNIKLLDSYAFSGCNKLKKVTFKGTKTKIGTNIFSSCSDVEIHAPAGSYAETYAKENNIPFVAE
ncbi:MAG: leucine-rich repeat protein [Oscillospiraceae bacterium]|nr:leucine-rich repeat protein [Oscillospiraceae bacterium]